MIERRPKSRKSRGSSLASRQHGRDLPWSAGGVAYVFFIYCLLLVAEQNVDHQYVIINLESPGRVMSGPVGLRTRNSRRKESRRDSRTAQKVYATLSADFCTCQLTTFEIGRASCRERVS